MRLFPPAQQGNEQDVLSDIDGQSAAITAGLSIATAGLVFKSRQVGKTHALRSGNKRLALIGKCIAYCTAATVPVALHTRYVEQRIAAHSNRSEDAPVPRTVYVDRVPNFDGDDMIIFGGLTGAVVASRIRRPGSVASLSRRYAKGMAFGAAPPILAFWMCKTFKRNENEGAWSMFPATANLVIKPTSSDLDLASPSDFMRSILDYAWSGETALVTEGPEKRPTPDGTSMAMLGMPSSSGGNNSPNSGGFPMGSPMNLEILTEGPHIAVKKNNKDPEIQPQTNYGWYSTNKIAELEEHISQMRAKRAQLAQEAEFIWAWLAEEEARHLEKFPVTKKAEENDPKQSIPAQESSMMVQTLGQVHANIWREAGACDWIIADSQKRIAQEKSLQAKGKVEWRSSCSEEASTTALNMTKEVLKTNLEMQSHIKNTIDQTLSHLAMSLADPSVDLNSRGMHPLKKRMATQKEIVKDIREHLEEQRGTAELFEKTLRKAMAEAERRAGRGS